MRSAHARFALVPHQVWNPNELADTSRNSLNHKHKLTPYQDMKLNGKVVATYVDGQQVSAISFAMLSICFMAASSVPHKFVYGIRQHVHFICSLTAYSYCVISSLALTNV